MPRANRDWQVFDLEAVEAGFVTILRGFDLAAYGRRSTEVRQTPCVELYLETEVVQGQRYLRFPSIRSDIVQPYNTWNFTLRCKCSTERVNNGTAHREIVGRVRAYLQYGWLTITWTENVAPYHSITDIREAGAPTEAFEEDNIDVTELSFTGMLNIRDSAWPLTIS
jgi:hypothetical protein